MTLLNLTQGAARELVAPRDVAALRSAGVLVEDPRRERPRWFDGRFLSARDLIRDQQYMSTREADLGRAAGSGVAAGLRVSEPAGARTLSIEAGHGITPAGELVLLPRRLDVALADIAAAEQLSARFGLGRIPIPPLRSRTGLFVLALRPVEYTANPIGAYPSSITGQRTVEDGDVIEATAVVLVPWQDDGAADALAARRGRVARNVFVAAASDGSAAATGANVLPLAMVALQNNALVWVDEALVRRELGADRGDLPGLGFSPRALRLAHLMQYQQHLADVQAAGNARGYPATTYFPALPPAGPLPPGVIDPADFTQNFFPAEIDVDFTPLPDDELPALIEDALALQPIDLTAPAEALDSTALMIVAPVPRAEWRAVVARLTTVVRVLKPAAPNLLAQRRPFEILQRLRLARVIVPPDPTSPSDTEWQRLAQLPSLWFVRRRQLALRDDYSGAWQAVGGVDERAVEAALRERLAGLGLGAQFDSLVGRASPAATHTLTHLLAGPRYAESPALTAAALGSLADAARSDSTAGTGPAPAVLDQASVLKVASQLSAPGAGTGIERLERAAAGTPIDAATLQRLASGVEWRKLDASASVASTVMLAKLARSALGTPAAAAASGDGTAPVASAAPVAGAAPAAPAPVADAAPAATVAPEVAIDPADTPGRGSTIVSPAAVASEAEAAPAPPTSTPAAAEAAPADDPVPAEGADAPAEPLLPKRSGKRGGK